MSVSNIIQLYNNSMIIGLSLLAMSIITSSLGSLFEFSFNLDNDINAFLPFNVSSFCLGLTVFGIIGRFTINKSNIIVSLMISITIAYIVYIVFYKKLVIKLRRNNPKAISTKCIGGKVGTVTLKIQKGSEGTIEVLDSTGAKLSYIAKMYDDETTDLILEGDNVLIMKYDTETNICFVYKI